MANPLVVDTSNNDPITLQQVKDSHCVALIAKGTEGINFEDSTYQTMRNIAKEAGIGFGAFLFLHASSNGNEAKYFSNYTKLTVGDITPIVDSEQYGLDGQPMSTMARRTLECLQALEQIGHYDPKPMWYSDASFALSLIAEQPLLKNYPVWEAQYVSTSPRWTMPDPSLRQRLKDGASVWLWQATDALVIDGHQFDASELLVPLETLLIKAPV